MKSKFYFISIILCINLNLFASHKNKIRKNILLIIFPGGQHKNIYMKSLFDFSLDNNN